VAAASTSQAGEPGVSAVDNTAPVVGERINYRCPAVTDITSLSPPNVDRILPGLIVGTQTSLGPTPPAQWALSSAWHVHLVVFGIGPLAPVLNVESGVGTGQWSYPSGS
jgi:hypothetical protein